MNGRACMTCDRTDASSYIVLVAKILLSNFSRLAVISKSNEPMIVKNHLENNRNIDAWTAYNLRYELMQKIPRSVGQ